MQAHIQKWGNSFGLRIPMQLAKQLHIHQGSAVTLKIENGRLIIQPARYDLEAMIEAITPENQHHSILDDELRGGEEW